MPDLKPPPTKGNAPANAEASQELAGDRSSALTIAPATDIPTSLAEYRDWLIEHRDDPQLVAGCARLGRLLGGAA